MCAAVCGLHGCSTAARDVSTLVTDAAGLGACRVAAGSPAGGETPGSRRRATPDYCRGLHWQLTMRAKTGPKAGQPRCQLAVPATRRLKHPQQSRLVMRTVNQSRSTQSHAAACQHPPSAPTRASSCTELPLLHLAGIAVPSSFEDASCQSRSNVLAGCCHTAYGKPTCIWQSWRRRCLRPFALLGLGLARCWPACTTRPLGRAV